MGIWLLLARLVFWAPDVAAYANDTLVGALVMTFAILQNPVDLSFSYLAPVRVIVGEGVSLPGETAMALMKVFTNLRSELHY